MKYQADLANQLETFEPHSHRADRAASGAEALDCRVSRRGETLVIAPFGRIDGGNAAIFDVRLSRALKLSPERLIIDLGGLLSISSHGLRILARSKREAALAGFEMAIARPSQAVRDILCIAGMTPFFTTNEGLFDVPERGLYGA
ncbi:MAG: STAS domain-containing protein [Erythrobacter sp.]